MLEDSFTMEEERVEEGFVREWAPCTRVLGLLPPRVQAGLFSTELCLTCVDAVSEYLALGTNVGLVYWYNRRKGTIERLRCEATQSGITCVKIVNTVDYMVAAGNTNGQVSVFQIPKELPESVPATLKPKIEPKVERYTIGELHRSEITAIEWSKNGMKLFSGDKNGVIIMTEIDFYMHLCKSVEIVNEQHKIVQVSYHQNSLLVSSLYRTIVCVRTDARWHISQVGKKERKSLLPLGAVFQWSYERGGAGDVAAYCARPGLRLWRADKAGDVHQTLLFKDAISNPMTVAELLNPSHSKHSHSNKEFGALHVFRDKFLVTHNQHVLYILDPRSLTALAVVDDLRRILSVSVHKDEIFILEGERSLLRLGYAPEVDALNTGDDPLELMTKSLSTSIKCAVSAVRELASLEPPSSPARARAAPPAAPLAAAHECFELPPVRRLPAELRLGVLQSLAATFERDRVARTDVRHLQSDVRLYKELAPACDALVYSSKRNRKRDSASASGTPRKSNGVDGKRNPSDTKGDSDASYTSTYVDTHPMHAVDDSDDEILKEIEEKEKILAKMLNLESLSIPSNEIHQTEPVHGDSPEVTRTAFASDEPVVARRERQPGVASSRSVPSPSIKRSAKETNVIKKSDDIVPKLAKVPQNWNLGSLQVMLDSMDIGSSDAGPRLSSPGVIEAEWEFV